MSEQPKRVVITGMGVVAPTGTGVDPFWNSVIKGKSGSAIIERLSRDGEYTRIGCEASEFDPEDFMDRKTARRSSRFIQFALASSQMALEQAKYEVRDPHKIGVYIGTGAGGFDALDNEYMSYFERGVKGISPFAVTNTIPNMAAGNIAIKWGLKGPCVAPVAACAAALYSVHDAFHAIRMNRIDAALAGGSESTLTSFVFGGYDNMRALSSRYDNPEAASRPFDKNRDGFVMGEGAGVFFMESYESAKERGATILAEVASSHITCDASHITSPDMSGETIARTMSGALENGNLEPEDISYVHAHGTSTKINDRVESGAIRKVFNDNGYDVPVTALKSMVGHTLGASGGLAMLTAIQSIHDGIIPPIINTEDIDEECMPLNLVTGSARNGRDVHHVMINAFGFGGHNACVVVKEPE